MGFHVKSVDHGADRSHSRRKGGKLASRLPPHAEDLRIRRAPDHQGAACLFLLVVLFVRHFLLSLLIVDYVFARRSWRHFKIPQRSCSCKLCVWALRYLPNTFFGHMFVSQILRPFGRECPACRHVKHLDVSQPTLFCLLKPLQPWTA